MPVGDDISRHLIKDEGITLDRVHVRLGFVRAAILDNAHQVAPLRSRRGGQQHADRRDQAGDQQVALAGGLEVLRERRIQEAIEGLLDDDGFVASLCREAETPRPGGSGDARNRILKQVADHPV